MNTLLEELVVEMAELPPLETLTAREEVTLILDRLVKKYGPDYVYPHASIDGADGNCRYADETWNREEDTFIVEGPSCILGHVMYLKSPQILDAVVGHGANEEAWMGENVTDKIPSEWADDRDLMKALENLQVRQDKGVAWGPAVETFKREVEMGEDMPRGAAVTKEINSGQVFPGE